MMLPNHPRGVVGAALPTDNRILYKPYERRRVEKGLKNKQLGLNAVRLLRRPKRGRTIALLVALGAATALSASAAASTSAVRVAGINLSASAVETHLYAFDRQQVETGFAAGAIAALGEDLLVAGRWGALAVVGTGGSVLRLPHGLPMNATAYRAHPDFSDFRHSQFLVADILLEPLAADRWRLFATHHYFEPGLGESSADTPGTAACIRFRLSATTIEGTAAGYAASPAWQTVFDAEPCLPTSGFDRGRQAGGRMVADGPSHLLLVTGDYGMDGRAGRGLLGIVDGTAKPGYMAAQLPESHFGKLLRVALRTGKAEVLASGLRNPQGLVRDALGNLWETEHGPKGGDELNLLKRGANYGWPLATHGVGAGGRLNVGDATAVGQHEGYEAPAFAWVPAIGVSAVAVNDAAALPLWRDDLLVGSLDGADGAGRSLFRVRRGGLQRRQVRYIERIPLDAPIRDLAQTPDGRIALLHVDGAITILRRSDAPCAIPGTVWAFHCPKSGRQ